MPWRSEIAALRIPADEPERRKPKATAAVQQLRRPPLGAFPVPGFPQQVIDANFSPAQISVTLETDKDLRASMHNLFTESRTYHVNGVAMAPLAIYRITYPINHPLYTDYMANANRLQVTLPKREVTHEVAHHGGVFTDSTRFLQQYLQERWYYTGTDPLGARHYHAANEQFLLHCTGWDRLSSIIANGFQGHRPTMQMSSGARFGKGNYFADDLALANQYSETELLRDVPFMTPPSETQAYDALNPMLSQINLDASDLYVKPVLFARVLLGTPAIVNDSSYSNRTTIHDKNFCDAQPAPCPPPGNGYDSIIRIGGAGSDKYRQFITFKDGMQLPTHVAFYTDVPDPFMWS